MVHIPRSRIIIVVTVVVKRENAKRHRLVQITIITNMKDQRDD